jgi:CBS domain containing-hemolysin-like protein
MSQTQASQGPRFQSGNGERRLFARLAEHLRRLMRRRGEANLRESVEELFEEHQDSVGALNPAEQRMLTNILSFNELKVEDVMVPRADIVAVEENASLAEILGVFREAFHSRLPIYRESLDEPVGMIHVKDLMSMIHISASSAEPQFKEPADALLLAKLRREVLFVPPSMPAIDLLLKMQKTRIHIALVIDEYGGTDGLVSIEDLVEEIVGDIEDEHDVDEAPTIARIDAETFDVDARCPLEDLEEATGRAFASPEQIEEFDTVGGLVTALAGRLPQRGELIGIGKGGEVEILDADPRRIKKLKLHLRGENNHEAERAGLSSDDPSDLLPPHESKP